MNDSYFLSAAKVDVYTSKYELFFFIFVQKKLFLRYLWFQLQPYIHAFWCKAQEENAGFLGGGWNFHSLSRLGWSGSHTLWKHNQK